MTAGRHPNWLMRCPACNVGQRGECDCLTTAAEAATDIGFEREPAPSTVAQRFRAHAAAWLAAIGLVALYGLAGDPPDDLAALGAPYLPGDGFPVELLAQRTEAPAHAASEAQP